MFRNYVTVALRNIAKNRLYSAINILGLAVGIASCILITLFVRGELSYDDWLPDSQRIVRLESRFDLPGRAPLIGGSSAGPALAALQKDFSQIETGVRLWESHQTLRRGNDSFQETVIFADPTFYDVFKLPMVAGQASLPDATAVTISASSARKYFGSEAGAVGKVIDGTFAFGSENTGPRSLHVTGVFKDLPDNTHLKIDFLARLNESDFEKAPWVTQQWTSINTMTYLKLRSPDDAKTIAANLKAFEDRVIPSITFNGQDFKVSDYLTLSLLPLTDIHLHSKGFGQMKPPGDVKSVTTFSVVAVMILIIACINFTNLATARASQRAREVALRKVLGAKRPQLVVQFLSESVLTALIALGIAIGLVEFALPTYNAVLSTHLALDVGSIGMLAAMFGLLTAVGVVAGLYPALYLSGFLPSRILKANKSAAAEGSGRLRTALVVVQFAISIGLLVCTAVVYGQTLYAKTMDVGYDREGLMVVRTANGKQAQEILQTLKQQALKVPGVMAATASDDVPTDTDENNTVLDVPGRPSPQPIVIGQKEVDQDFFATYRVKLLAGRVFDQEHGGDLYPEKTEDRVALGANIILNRAAMRRLGFGSPQETVGQGLYTSASKGGEKDQKRMTVTVIGVVDDFSFRSAREEIEPMVFLRRDTYLHNLTVRFDGVPAAARDGIGKVWHELAPDSPYRADFLDQLIQEQYKAETAQSEMFAAFAALAIIIACLGLYGSAAFTAERRTKEIGIRKVLGAKVPQVVQLLVWDFSKPVMLANLIAWPAAWLLMRDWLNGFQYRIALNPGVFAAAGLAALVVAWATVAAHAARAARSNPIHALRYE